MGHSRAVVLVMFAVPIESQPARVVINPDGLCNVLDRLIALEVANEKLKAINLALRESYEERGRVIREMARQS